MSSTHKQKTPLSDFHPSVMTGADSAAFGFPNVFSPQRSHLERKAEQSHRRGLRPPSRKPSTLCKAPCRHGASEELMVTEGFVKPHLHPKSLPWTKGGAARISFAFSQITEPRVCVAQIPGTLCLGRCHQMPAVLQNWLVCDQPQQMKGCVSFAVPSSNTTHPNPAR